jgi:hypothetical protein
VGLVARLLEGRHVVVEPPVQAGILGVAKIDADVGVAVEQPFGDGWPRALVFQGGEGHVQGGSPGDVFTEEAGVQACGAAAVEAIAVVKHT